MKQTSNPQSIKLVFVGNVDHGKSTLIGRLLEGTNTLPESAIQKVKNYCDQQGRPFEHAFLLDALQEEQEQGITIDITKIEFSTGNSSENQQDAKHFTIIDAPGHKEFLKNMISGSAQAEAAILLVDAQEGLGEQTKKHAYLLSLLGVSQLLVAINKMDLVNFSEERFNQLKEELDLYLERVKLSSKCYIPVSAKLGDNVIDQLSRNMPWYRGKTVLASLKDLEKPKGLEEKPLRFPIQDVYKFDHRRILAGRIEAGSISVGDSILLLPLNKRSKIKSLEYAQEKDRKSKEHAGHVVGITLEDEFYFKRGEVIVHAGISTDQPLKPVVSNLFPCHVFWMGKEDLMQGKIYTLKLATQEVPCEIHTINKIIDASTLETIPSKLALSKNDVGTLVIKTKEPVVFDAFHDIATMGRFVLVDDLIVCGGGIIEKSTELLRERPIVTTQSPFISPKSSLVQEAERRQRFGHHGKVIWITGLPGCGKEEIAQYLERVLFDEGKNVFYLDAATMRFGLTSDLDFSPESRHEQARRVAEAANILLHAGCMVVVSIVSPFKDDRAYVRSIIGEDNFIEVFVDAPIEICREKKSQVYAQAEIPSYEPSEYLVHTLSIRTKEFSVQEKVKDILRLLSASKESIPASRSLVWSSGAVSHDDRIKLLNFCGRNKVLWFTGLSGSGKSSIARAVEKKLHEQGKLCYVIDGDNLRHGLNQDLGFTREDREENIRRAGHVAKLLHDAGLFVIASFVSPYASDRNFVRQLIGSDFIEIFVDCPLEICEQRDTKGMYKKARAGLITDFTGISQPYEKPEKPELVLDSEHDIVETNVEKVLKSL